MSKSFTALEAKICIVTGQQYETGAILLRKDLKEEFEGMYAVTGYGICPEEQKLLDEGYLAFVEIDTSKSKASGSTAKPEDVFRTGRVFHLKEKFAEEFLNLPNTQQINYIDQELGNLLMEMENRRLANQN